MKHLLTSALFLWFLFGCGQKPVPEILDEDDSVLRAHLLISPGEIESIVITRNDCFRECFIARITLKGKDVACESSRGKFVSTNNHLSDRDLLRIRELAYETVKYLPTGKDRYGVPKMDRDWMDITLELVDGTSIRYQIFTPETSSSGFDPVKLALQRAPELIHEIETITGRIWRKKNAWYKGAPCSDENDLRMVPETAIDDLRDE